MANQQQLKHLLQGVKDWNVWRKQHPDIHPDLNEADLSRTYLREADLSNANLSNADLSRANLVGANLVGANLNEAYLNRANLSNACLNRANLSNADFSSAYLYSAYLDGADLSNANLSNANLSSANLSNACLNRANLSNANLISAYLYRADLIYANLSNADLISADLRRADLNTADLNTADLSNADLIYTNLTYTNLSNADLSQAKVGLTIFGNVDLRTVKGLETVRHIYPSTIGADTLLRSEGDILETFLRKAGLTDTFITYTRSLTQNAFEYYTCFISYSSKDQEFVERLYTDLQAKGVRCWYAPEDLKIGEKFWQRIDEGIHLQDKLLVVLSEHSVNSVWVEHEVIAALEKEQQQNKLVLFPIKLDERVMQTSLPWAASIRRTRHMGDFTHWREHDVYQKGLMRLMRDLQPDHPPTSQS